MTSPESKTSPTLKQQIGIGGATFLGLGSIIGSGVFVSIGLAADIAGPAVVLAVAVAAGIAICNGLSSAQLAASHPVSGGTYEYGHKYLSANWGFAAGWLFLCAKSASAATAALGASSYVLQLVDRDSVGQYQVPLALGLVIVLTWLTASGVRRSSNVNAVIVLVTLISLAIFAAAVVWIRRGDLTLLDLGASEIPTSRRWRQLGEACALMFVAYTGYGRVATLGEEIQNPHRNIPRAVIVTLLASFFLYLGIAVVCLLGGGLEQGATLSLASGSYLVAVTKRLGASWLTPIITVGAVTAMLGVLLNLILGLSRVVLAMGRRGDMPTWFAELNKDQSSPTRAVLFIGVVTAGLVCLGDVRTTWSFSAWTVLIYYALTNLCAIQLPSTERLYSVLFAWCGLLSCLVVGFCVPMKYWLTGIAMLVIGFVLRVITQKANGHQRQ